MMRQGHHASAAQRKLFYALALFVLPGFSLVDAQQQHQQHRQPAPREAADARRPLSPQLHGQASVPRHPIAAALVEEAAFPRSDDGPRSPPEADGAIPPLSLETAQRKRPVSVSSAEQRASRASESEPHNTVAPDDASALATLAPDRASVRAPPPPHRATTDAGYGLSSPHIARSLEDWDVEDFVLLATVDGDLHAAEKSGTPLWHIETEQPVVEITHHRANVTTADENYQPVDHYIWALEPSRDGAIFILTPHGLGNNLVPTDLTMKQLVEMTPFADRHSPILYTGRKESTMVILDAATGRVHGWYGSGGDSTVKKYQQDDSCLPQNDFDDSSKRCPVNGTIALGRTDYIVYVTRTDIVDQPLVATLKYSEWGPNTFDRDLHQQYRSTRDNQYITSKPDGQVFRFSAAHASSGKQTLSLPYRLSAPICRAFDIARPADAPKGSNPQLLVLPQPPPPLDDTESARLRSASVFMNKTHEGSFYALTGMAYPLVVNAPRAQITLDGFWDHHQDLDWTDFRQALVGKHSLQGAEQRVREYPLHTLPGRAAEAADEPENDPVLSQPQPPPQLPAVPADPTNVIDKVIKFPQVAATSIQDFFTNPTFYFLLLPLILFFYRDIGRWCSIRMRKLFLDPPEAKTQEPEQPEETGPAEHPQILVEPTEEGARDVQVVVPADAEESQPLDVSEDTPSEPKKKKTHRGQRGGTKHRKGKNKRAASQDDSPPPDDAVKDAVDKAMEMGDRPRQLEPDIVTISRDVQEVSGPHFRMDSLEVDEDRQLGTGSNGTVVFAGKFDGRDVAVKRMLIQFYDIASQETRLLKESDDHRNVIRYYAQQQRDAFLYIALELCQASLAEIVEKPHLHRQLATAGALDMPNVLYQIVNGISHLHSLRIVHRDLKPQNILVNMERDGRPRLLVSDFGLCKKLEGGQSSFGATTAHAAGTSGWRAPELLLDDDSRDAGTALVDAGSTHSGSGSLVSSDLLPNRRATRAIDIFSLGLVFYYVLSQGFHPFDCGDRYMREVNIRKGSYNLDKLEALGDSGEEATDLIETMIRANPRERPSAEEVMSHPFFWDNERRLAFLCHVSDHFEKEPRDPPSQLLKNLESHAEHICQGDFLKQLPREFVDSLGKQRKYTGTRLLDLLRALRNKSNHYEDMPDTLKAKVGSLPDGYLRFWTSRFPTLLITCWHLGWLEGWASMGRFRKFYLPVGEPTL